MGRFFPRLDRPVPGVVRQPGNLTAPAAFGVSQNQKVNPQIKKVNPQTGAVSSPIEKVSSQTEKVV
jgi:hypothetical protein